MKYKIFIDGQEGTTGLRILDRLKARRDIELLTIDQENRKNIKVRLAYMAQADITFLCLPDAAAKEIIELADPTHRILDTSTAHRTHPDWVYGLPELGQTQREKIRKAKRVAVPGCHATGFVLLAKPLTALGILSEDYPFVCHSITGYSGGGKNMIAQYESLERAQQLSSPRQYGLTQNHKHLPEMNKFSQTQCPPIFHPVVGDFYSGMLFTLSLHGGLMKKKLTISDLCKVFQDYYKDQPLIEVLEEDGNGGFLAANTLAGCDNLQIFVLGQEERITLAARYDNLGKGASGAAIQCMNLMLGLPEETGLITQEHKEDRKCI